MKKYNIKLVLLLVLVYMFGIGSFVLYSKATTVPQWLSWSGKAQIETVPVMKAGKTAIIVTGDANRNKVLTVPGGGMVTVKIELPSNWDSLMKDLGYKALSSYNINFSNSTNTSSKYLLPQNDLNEQGQSTIKTNSNSSNGNYNNRKPTPEEYRKIREQRATQNGSTQRRSNSLNSTNSRRPTPEQYRKMRQNSN